MPISKYLNFFMFGVIKNIALRMQYHHVCLGIDILHLLLFQTVPTPPPSRYPSAACDRSVTRYSRWCTSYTRFCTSVSYPPPWTPTPGDGSWRSSNGLCLPRTVTASIWRLRSKRSAIYFSLFQSSLNLAIPLDLNGFRDFFFPSQIISSQEIMDLDYHWFFMKMYESMKSSPIELVKI